jgi:UDP-3-O-[3-hydroxymyristoyl] glucosamine N-acyltransferase
MLLIDLARYLGVEIHYAGKDLETIEIHEAVGLLQARPGSLSFLSNPAYASRLSELIASALIIREATPHFAGPQLLHPDPHFAYAKAALLFYKPDHGPLGVSPHAHVDATAQIGVDVRIHPGVVIGPRAVVGDRVVLYPGVYLGAGVSVGNDCVLHPHVVVYADCLIGARCLIHAGTVIGADGFGFAVSRGEICKIPQLGRVRIEDDVEMGANCTTVDRAANGETVIRRSVKFDNQVHIAHGVEIGENTMFSAQTGIAGSTKVGKWVLMGGQSGIADHLEVPDGTKVGGKSGLIHSPEAADTYVGFPAAKQSEWRRGLINIKRVSDYEKRLRALEKRLDALGEGAQPDPS